MTDRTVKCPICRRPYVVYGYYVGDQSACRKCRREARKDEHPQEWGKFYQRPLYRSTHPLEARFYRHSVGRWWRGRTMR